MSLSDLAGQLLGGQQPGCNPNLLTTLLNVVNSQPGGVAGLVETFQQKGLGGIVSSWVGTGANQAISPQQVENALGNQQVADIASKLGVSTQDASSHIAQWLPAVIDHLTPNGQVPSSGTNLMEMGAGLIKALCK
ncbi:MAG TPA: YidB family protein [Bryobacteraceae bacterium]